MKNLMPKVIEMFCKETGLNKKEQFKIKGLKEYDYCLDDDGLYCITNEIYHKFLLPLIRNEYKIKRKSQILYRKTNCNIMPKVAEMVCEQYGLSKDILFTYNESPYVITNGGMFNGKYYVKSFISMIKGEAKIEREIE